MKRMTFILVFSAAWLLGGYARDHRLWAQSQKDGYPDYITLEFPKPLPPVDKQRPAIKPGSIELKVGAQKKSAEESDAMDYEQPQISRRAHAPDESEPPLDMNDETQTPSSAALPRAAALDH